MVSQAVPSDAAIISMESVSWGWASPLSVEGLRVLDGRGMPLLEARRITGEKSLWSLLVDQRDLGSWLVSAPWVHLHLRPDGSNLEDVLSKLSFEGEQDQTSSESFSAGVAARVSITDARITANDESTGTTWTVGGLNADAKVPQSSSEDWVVFADGELESKPFEVRISAPLGQASEQLPIGPSGEARLTASALPLAPLRTLVDRTGHNIERIEGSLSAELLATWRSESTATLPHVDASVSLSTKDLRLSSTEILRDDTLQVDDFRATVDCRLNNGELHIINCDVNSDFGHSALSMKLKLADLLKTGKIGGALRGQQFESTGELRPCRVSQDTSINAASARSSRHRNRRRRLGHQVAARE